MGPPTKVPRRLLLQEARSTHNSTAAKDDTPGGGDLQHLFFPVQQSPDSRQKGSTSNPSIVDRHKGRHRQRLPASRYPLRLWLASRNSHVHGMASLLHQTVQSSSYSRILGSGKTDLAVIAQTLGVISLQYWIAGIIIDEGLLHDRTKYCPGLAVACGVLSR